MKEQLQKADHKKTKYLARARSLQFRVDINLMSSARVAFAVLM
jgi:hypothetical protein